MPKPYSGPLGYDPQYPPRYEWQKAVKLGGNVKFLREWYRLTQNELSEVSDIPASTINSIENRVDRYPNLFPLCQLSRIFDVSLEDLVFKDLRKKGSFPECSEAMEKYFYG